MKGKKNSTRKETASEFKWDIEAMYPDESNWEKDFLAVVDLSSQYGKYSGKLGQSPSVLLEAFIAKELLLCKLLFHYSQELKSFFPINTINIEDFIVPQYQ